MILEADSIGKSFGTRRILTAASLRARAGTVTALLGRNGAGKSTLLKVAAGWIAADYGIVRFAGRVYPRPRLAELARRGLFYLADRTFLEPSQPLGRQLTTISERFQGPPAGEVAEALGLGDQLATAPGRLSGGELRRAEVAAAVARRPLCVVADEPFRGTAPLDIEMIVGALRRLAVNGCAVVISGHEVTTMLAAADRFVWCVAGTTHEYESVEAVRADLQFQREYFGYPL